MQMDRHAKSTRFTYNIIWNKEGETYNLTYKNNSHWKNFENTRLAYFGRETTGKFPVSPARIY